ncbi:MAG: class I SAM-dependent methyltransferase [Planctomycetota bacterium]
MSVDSEHARPDPIVPGFGPDRCRAYLEGNEGAPPREQLVHAVERFRSPAASGGSPYALDVGCGPGREAAFLRARGFRVLAVDPVREMLERTRAAVAALDGGADGLETLHATLEECADALPIASFDLVHAGFVLPFVRPSDFGRSFAALERSMKPGGVFVGQLFGPSDEFVRDAPADTITSHDGTELPALFGRFDLLAHDEIAREGRIGRGRAKWWHVHHVIARLR